MPITYISASDQGVSSISLNELEYLEYINLYDNDLNATDVDETLIQRATLSMSDGYINLAGTNANRTSSSDVSLEQLIDDGNEVWINQSNSDTTVIGIDDETGYSGVTGNYVWASRFTANSDAIINSFDIYLGLEGKAKIAIYSNNGGVVGDRLTHSNTEQDGVVGWNRFYLPAYKLDNGVLYYLCGISDTTSCITRETTSGTVKYGAETFSGFEWPATGSAWTSSTSSQFKYCCKI